MIERKKVKRGEQKSSKKIEKRIGKVAKWKTIQKNNGSVKELKKKLGQNKICWNWEFVLKREKVEQTCEPRKCNWN